MSTISPPVSGTTFSQRDGFFKNTVKKVYPMSGINKIESFVEAAKDVALVTHMSELKHEKAKPKSLDAQYKDEMKQLYMMEYPDYVPYEKEQKCCKCCCFEPCCACDPVQTKDTWDLFKEVFPPNMFYFLVFTGAISSKSRTCDCFLRTFWFLFGGIYALLGGTYLVLLFQTLLCNADANCLIIEEVEITDTMRIIFGGASSIIPMYMVPFYVRDQFRSHELRTLVFSVDPRRAGEPRYPW